MDKYEKERLSKYGTLVWDFANSKTTDDILTSFFENLQTAFHYSSDFKEKALLQYPTMKMTIDSLSHTELTLLRMLLARNNILKSCNESFWVFNQYWKIEKYDPIRQKLVIDEAELSYSESHTPDNEKIYSFIRKNIISVHSQKIESYIDNLSFAGIAKEEAEKSRIKLMPDKNIKTVLKQKIQQLVKQCQMIEKFKRGATNRFKEIEIIAGFYPKIFKFHDYLKAIQGELKTTLLEVIEAEHAYESKKFKRVLEIYNSNVKRIYTVTNNKIVEFDTFTERFFLGSQNEYIFNVAISFCLIEYLKNPEYSGKERISVCQKCDCIFSKTRLNEQQKYCPVCSRKNKMTPEERADYMKGYRANPARRRAIEKEKRETRIRHLMTNAGKTKKQAEFIVDNEM